MTHRVAGEIEGRVLASVGENNFFRCSWTLDPASHRLVRLGGAHWAGGARAARAGSPAALRVRASSISLIACG
jgi:hypothetical protein